MANSKQEKVSVTDFLKEDYKDFAYYVIESRALPSLVDGFKPTQRKIVYVADRNVRKSPNKVATLAGKIISEAQYHHGNTSCESSIVNMAQDFKNNMPLLNRIGQFGSLKSPVASASRYISVTLSSNFDLIYKDKDLLTHKVDEGMTIEPEYYLPIIPMVLVNGGSGIAVGYASNILNRDVRDITRKCISYIEGKRMLKLKLSITDFEGDFVADKEKDNKWFIKGILKKENTSTVQITELPPSMTYDKFEKHLEKLQDERKITGYDNNGKDGNIDYVVRFTREDLKKYTGDKLYNLFKLTDQVTENFTVLDENGKLKEFDNAEDILKYFVDFRISYYDKRKKFLLEKIVKDVKKLDNRAKFIKGILDNKIIINKKKKEQIIPQIAKLKIEMIDESYDYLLSMPILSLTKEKYDELLVSIKTKKEEQKVIKKSVPKQVYLDELSELLKKL
jgi:DNA topoisomerase-2